MRLQDVVKVKDSTTIVTMLYNIGRHDRSFKHYIKTFPELLKHNCPMVIYTSEDLVELIHKHRPPTYPTYINVVEFDNLPYKYRLEKYTSLIKEYKEKSVGPRCIEYRNAKYPYLVSLKIDLMAEVAKINRFGSKYFLWVDSGMCRWDPGNRPYELSVPYPSESKMRAMEGKFLSLYFDHQNTGKPPGSITCPNDTLEEQNAKRIDYIKLEPRTTGTVARLMGGTAESIFRVHEVYVEEIDRIFTKMKYSSAFENTGLICTEERIMDILADRYPEYFHYISNCFEGKRAKIYKDTILLSYAWNINLPRDDSVKLFSCVDDDIDEGTFKMWYRSVKSLGYNPTVLRSGERELSLWGHGETMGVRQNKLCLDYLLSETGNDIYLFAKSTDVIIVAPPSNLKEKFIHLSEKTGCRVLVAEICNSEITGEYHRECTNSDGSMMVGYREDLINLYRSFEHNRCGDDTYGELTPPHLLKIDDGGSILANVDQYPHDSWHYHGAKLINANGDLPCVVRHRGAVPLFMLGKFKRFFPGIGRDVAEYDWWHSLNYVYVILAILVIIIVIVIIGYVVIRHRKRYEKQAQPSNINESNISGIRVSNQIPISCRG